jgi:hypothetical protein
MTMGAETLPRAHEVVEVEAHLRALAVAEPADARGQALKGHALLGELDPAAQRGVVRARPRAPRGRCGDVRGVARERDPAEGPAPAELRPDVRRDEARDLEGVGAPRVLGLAAEVVAVVAGDGPARCIVAHRRASPRHACAGARDVALGSLTAQGAASSSESPGGHVAQSGSWAEVCSVTKSGRDAAAHELGVHLGGVAHEPDGDGLPRRRRRHPGERLVEGVVARST